MAIKPVSTTLASFVFITFGLASLSWGAPTGAWPQLMAKAKNQDVQVIIQLHDSDSFNKNLSTRKAQTRRIKKVESLQNEFLSTLTSQGHRPGNIKKFSYMPFIALSVNSATLSALKNNPNVAGIEEDVMFRANLLESNPLIGGDIVFNDGYSGAGQTIAILDTGVDKTHSFFGGRVVSEACYSTNNPLQSLSSVCPGGVEQSTALNSGLNCDALDPTLSTSGCNHGTHVAGIAAGNGASFNGIARDADLIAIQVFSKLSNVLLCLPFSSPCLVANQSDILLAGERVLTLSSTLNIASVNLSLGGQAFASTCDASFPSEKILFDNLRAQGIAPVVASSNDGLDNSIGAPGCISSAVSVGSTTKSDVISSFSNTASFLSLLAPGEAINSSVPGNAFDIFSGTSMATPQVSGAWAVIKQAALATGAGASVTEILSALQTSGTPVTHPTSGLTFQRIQVNAAIDSLTTGSPQQDFLVDLGGTAFDMELDPSRDLLYVSVPSLNEVVMISTLNYTIVDRIVVGSRPHGIDLSYDSSRLFVALNGGGGVAFLDLETKTVSTVLVQGEVGDSRTYDVIEAKPNRLFVSANASSSGFSYIAMIKLDEANTVSRVANNRIIRAAPNFLKDPNDQFLYIGEQFSPNSLYKLDISLDTAPIILEDNHGAVSGTSRLDISPDGTRIYLGSGQILDTSTFFQTGTIGVGLPALNKDGSSAFIGRSPNLIDVYNTSTFLKVDEINTLCPTTGFQRLKILPGTLGWVVLGNDKVCVRDLKATSLKQVLNDFDANRQSDLLGYNTISNEIGQAFIESAAIQTMGILTTLDPLAGWTVQATGDFNGDQKVDLLLINSNTNELAVALLNGGTILSSSILLDLTATGFTLHGTGDFDGDGKTDLLLFNPTTGKIRAVIINDTIAVSFSTITTLDTTDDWSLIDNGDFNGDTFSDLLLYNTVSGEVAVALWDGSLASIESVTTLPPASNRVVADTADFNGDGNSDLWVLNTVTGDASVIALDGSAVLSETPAVPVDLAGGWSAINAGNYNGDNFADYLLINTTGEIRVILLEDGEFISQYDLLTLDIPGGWTLLSGKP
jgi:subtilisin family serine protease